MSPDATLQASAKAELQRRIQGERCRYYTPNGGIERWLGMVARSAPTCRIPIIILRAGNSLGKTCLAANLAAYISGRYPNAYFDKVPYIRDFRRPNRGRILTTANAAETAYDEEFAKWLPTNGYTGVRGGHKFNQVYQMKATGSTFDIFTFDRDPMQGESVTLDWAIVDEPMSRRHFSALKRGLRFGGPIFFIFTALEGAGWYKHVFETPERLGRDVFCMELSSEENCFPVGVEILTDRGWRPIGLVNIGDRVLAVGDDGLSSMEPVTAAIRRHFSGDLLRADRRLPATTPDHRMWVFSSDRGADRRVAGIRGFFKDAADLTRGYRMIGQARPRMDGRLTKAPFDGITIEDWAEFLGWYVSEGCSSGTKSGNVRTPYVYISQNPGPKRDAIRNLLARTPWKWRERRGEIFTHSKELHAHLFQLGWSLNKRLPSEVFDYPESARLRLWKALLDGDGDGVSRYVTISPGLADDVQRLLIGLGHRAHVRRWNTSSRKCSIHKKAYAMRDQYCVSVAKDRFYYVNNAPRKEPYSGEVACVEVPSGRIVVRDQSEKYPLVVGNCKTHGIRGILDHETLESQWEDFEENELPARRDGKYMTASGLIYLSYIDQDWSDPATGRIVGHVMKSLEGYHRNCWDRGLFTVYHIVDPHDRKPFAMNWRAVFPNGDRIVFAEWPDESMKMFHKMRSCVWDIEKYAMMVKATERELLGRPADFRLMDPNFGNAPKATSKTTVREEFDAEGKKLSWPMQFITEINDGLNEGHIAVKSVLGDPAHGVRPKQFVMEHCRNTRFGLGNYAYKENKSESSGLSERPQFEFKDFPDLDRLGEMFSMSYYRRVERDSPEFREAAEKRARLWRPYRNPNTGFVGMA